MEQKIEDHKTDCTKNDSTNTQPLVAQEPVESAHDSVTDKVEHTVLIRGKFKVINGVWFNDRGYEICGVLNQHNKPCQRIGTCPFHSKNSNDTKEPAPKVESPNSDTSSADAKEKESQQTTLNKVEDAVRDDKLVLDKKPFKQGWTKEEHLLFLQGLEKFGKGSWKEIAQFVGTRNATQIQSHAQKYFLRREKPDKSKRSIHDYSLTDLQKMLSVRTSPQEQSIQQTQAQNTVPYSVDPTQQHVFSAPSQMYNTPNLQSSQQTQQQQPQPAFVTAPAPMISMQPNYYHPTVLPPTPSTTSNTPFFLRSNFYFPSNNCSINGNGFIIPPISELKNLTALESSQENYSSSQQFSLPSIRVLEQSLFHNSPYPSSSPTTTFESNSLYRMDKKRPYPFAASENANTNNQSFKYRAHNFKG